MSIAAKCTCGKHPYYCGGDCPKSNNLFSLNTINVNNENIKLLRDKLAKLILLTPTGDVRNELTDISILFENIINN